MIPEIAAIGTPRLRAASIAGRSPGTPRIGATDRNGLDGAAMMASAFASASRTSARARAEAPRPHDVRREVAITQPEPGLLAVSGEHLGARERLAGNAPAPVAVVDPGQPVHDRVVVGAQEQPAALEGV